LEFFIFSFLSAEKSFILGELALAVAFFESALSLEAGRKFCKRFVHAETTRIDKGQRLPLLARV
jgi:hypothetical protein